MSISSSFAKLKLFQKIEIYILVIMFYGTIYYYLEDIYPIETKVVKTIDENKNISKVKVINIKKLNINETIKLLDTKAISLDIIIDRIDINKNISISFSGKYIDCINMLSYMEQHLKIDNIKLKKVEKNIEVKVDIVKRYFFNKGIIDKNYKDIPFIFTKIKEVKIKEIKKEEKKEKKIDSLKLIAIFFDEVNINNIWYKNKDFIKENQQITILDNNSIMVENIKTKDKKILYVYNKIPLSK